MDDSESRILACLRAVANERAKREADPALGARVKAVKQFQHARFARTYSDLLDGGDYSDAAGFFLRELYGPFDFSARDQQFERVAPGIVRLFPSTVIDTILALAELHELSERLDTEMGAALGTAQCDDETYSHAWRAVSQPAARERQIALTLSIGASLIVFTRRALLRRVLKALRRPAIVLGIQQLHRFLESGFDTFHAMPNPQYFLDLIGQRERQLAAALFAGAITPYIQPQK